MSRWSAVALAVVGLVLASALWVIVYELHQTRRCNLEVGFATATIEKGNPTAEDIGDFRDALKRVGC